MDMPQQSFSQYLQKSYCTVVYLEIYSDNTKVLLLSHNSSRQSSVLEPSVAANLHKSQVESLHISFRNTDRPGKWKHQPSIEWWITLHGVKSILHLPAICQNRKNDVMLAE